MEQSLYPNILFHFTKSKEKLFGILKETFKPSFCKEKIDVDGRSPIELAVPMVSFCDLKLKDLQEQMKKYGNYGIGLTKKWAINNGLNPVYYVNKKSHLTKGFADSISSLYDYIDTVDDGDEYTSLTMSYHALLNMYRFMKNYEGKLNRQNTRKIYRFADEREWRYVPPLNSTWFHDFVNIKSISTKDKKEILNNKIEHLKLVFEPEDIKYLIIENDSEIIDVINHLKKVKSKYDTKTINRLTTRILTSEQIKDDI